MIRRPPRKRVRLRSAGLLPYRNNDTLEVLVAHPGGPFWAKKDEGAWSVVKGLIDTDEEPTAAAAREFAEETGWAPPPEPWIDLGEVRLRSGKVVVGWAVPGDYDPETLEPGEFTTVLRGKPVTFPEIDRVAWFDLETARRKLNPAYGDFLDRLERQAPRAG
jgi:predicted NUDIX family NTP pyrophosphohydrolase